MAENDFWQSLVNAARNKTSQIVGSLKSDVNELSSTLNSEANHFTDVVKQEASKILGNFKGTLSLDRNPISFSGKSSIIRDLWCPDTVHDELSPIIIMDSKPIPMTEVQYRHHLLVTERKNFTDGFSAEEEREANAWFFTAGEDFHDVELLGKHLTECPSLAEMYTRLVPEEVSHSDFWKRYFYRRHLILDHYSREDVGNDYVIKSYNSPVVEGSHEEPKKLKKAADDFITVEIDNPYMPFGDQLNDWDIEFEIERVKGKDDSSLSDITSISVD